jgi:hypothetical protein
MEPAELQVMFERILQDTSSTPSKGEEKLAALTAWERVHWAKTRTEFFSKGVNKSSLDLIEKAAFVLVLDDEEYHYDPVSFHHYCIALTESLKFLFLVCRMIQQNLIISLNVCYMGMDMTVGLINRLRL